MGKTQQLGTLVNGLTVDANGNVGIATTPTTDRLTISGNTTVLGSVNVSSYQYFTSIYGGYIFGYTGTTYTPMTYSASYHAFSTSGTEKLRITNSGNVGIGTSSPSGKLNIIGGELRWGFTSDLGVLSYSDNKPILASVGATDFLFYTNGLERLRIGSGGNVLIGTTSDDGNKLQVNGNISSSRIFTSYSGIKISGYGALSQTLSGEMTILGHNIIADTSAGNTVRVMNSGWYSSMIKQYYNEGITFHTSTTVYNAGDVYPMTSTERMRITSGGNVLIGTISDNGFKLEVNGSIRNAGISTQNGQVSAPSGTIVNLYTINSYGIWVFYVDLPAGSGDTTNYSAYAIVCNTGNASRILHLVNGGLINIYISGNVLQASQGSGGTYNIRYVFQKIGY